MTANLRVSFALALTAVTTLMLELLLMRVFDVILTVNMAYMVITCAMFAFGLAGIYATLRPPRLDETINKYLGNLAIFFGIFALILLPVLNWLPFDFGKIGTETLSQLIFFGLMYFALMVPFFLSGLIFATVFSAYSSQIQTLYFFDLCGAAIGCIFFIPFIPHIGPGGLIFVASGLSFVAAILFIGNAGKTSKVFALVTLVVICIPFLRTDGYFDFDGHADKRGVERGRDAGDVERTYWDPIAKIDVIKWYDNYASTGSRNFIRRMVAYDGGNQQSNLYPFDGDYVGLRQTLLADPASFVDHFWNRSVVASHWMKADSGAEVLIIGSAAGQETKGALTFNAKHVDAIEMVRAVVELSKNEYGAYIGNVFSDPRVDVRVGEGRTYLQSMTKKYDIIQMYSNHTSSSMAAGGGASSASYLQTVEAYMEYFSSLKDDGILHINHHIYPRMVVTAAAAWQNLGRSDFRSHVIVYERPGQDNIPLVMFKMAPWTVEEIDRLNGFMLSPGIDHRDTYRLSENPLVPTDSFLSNSFYDGSMSRELIDQIPYHIEKVTDNKPFFNFLRRELGELEIQPDRFVNASTAGYLNSQLAGGRAVGARVIPMDVAHYFVTAAAALFFTIIFVFIPLFFAGAGKARWAGEFTSLFYFSCLGAGFIIIELTFIQIFMKLIGYPLYTYSAVLFTILFAAGLGSLSAKQLEISPVNRWWWPFAGTVLFGVLLWLIHPLIFERFLASSMPIRVTTAALMMFPISFFMGMAFPLGILAIEKKPRGAIAWAWGMNGLFTNIGGIGAALLSIYLGFKMTLLLALLIYALAGMSFRRLGRLANESY